MTALELEKWILDNYLGVIVLDAYKERSFFYNPDGSLPKGIYFATIKESDGPNDKASKLGREGVYRLSIGVGKKQYRDFFGPVPQRPAKGEIIDLEMDFAELGTWMPHPIYAWLGWVCINNPKAKDEMLKYLMDISFDRVGLKYQKLKSIQ